MGAGAVARVEVVELARIGAGVRHELREVVGRQILGGTQTKAVLTPTMAMGVKSAMTSNGTFIRKGSARWPETVR